ncbi:MAG: hypothetical protein GY715_13020, partial [Planctomycetes bacterium]|nr:hypothetical protein [Planctomycetota bacterium]
WGIAFKPQTDDIREAPAVDLMERALAAGAEVRAFDPAAAAVLAKRLPAVTTYDSMYDTVDGADALVVCTEWSEFRHPDLDRIATLLKNPVIFDGRNIYRRHQMERMGYTYYAVGRPVVNPLGAMSAETAPRASGVNAPA